MGNYKRRRLKLQRDHAWAAKPGYKIFVADRGAVRFDFPESWLVIPTDDSIGFHDHRPPDDNCALRLSVMRLPPGDWSGLRLPVLVREILDRDRRDVRHKGEIVEVRRPDLDLAWAEVHFVDPTEKREAHSRACLARAANIQPLLTFDYWADDAPRFAPVWDDVLDSLRVGQFIPDPTRGDVRHRWN